VDNALLIHRYKPPGNTKLKDEPDAESRVEKASPFSTLRNCSALQIAQGAQLGYRFQDSSSAEPAASSVWPSSMHPSGASSAKPYPMRIAHKAALQLNMINLHVAGSLSGMAPCDPIPQTKSTA